MATSHTRLKARDHCTSSKSHQWKRWSRSRFASHYTSRTNWVSWCKMDVKSTWIPTWHQVDHVSWSLVVFSKPPLGGRLTQTRWLWHSQTSQPLIYYTIFLGIFPLLELTVLNIIYVLIPAAVLALLWESSPGPAVMACQVHVLKDRHLDLGLNFWCSSQIVWTYLTRNLLQSPFSCCGCKMYTKYSTSCITSNQSGRTDS
jgi:hypothetical protein